MLEIQGLRKIYPGEKQPALEGIDLTVETGEFVAVLGKSGAGKSSLIRCINRLVEPDEGRIVWNGREITGLPAKELRRARGKIGMIFQRFNLLPRVGVLTNVIVGDFSSLPLRRSLFWSFSRAEKDKALAALREVGLERYAGRRVDDLSGGQQQRVAIARVLMQEPELLLGDEPVASLDPLTSERIMQFVARLHRERGMTVIMNLHDVGLARQYAARVIGLADGRVVFDGPPELLDDEALKLIYPQDEE